MTDIYKNWPKNIKRNIEYPDQSLYSFFNDIAENNTQKTAIMEGAKEYTYGVLREYSNKLAKFFEEFGLVQNDTVSICLPNTVWMVVSIFATFQIGAKVTLINPRLSSREILFQVNNSGSKVLITSPSLCNKIGTLDEKYNFMLKIVTPQIIADGKQEDCLSDYILLESILDKEQRYTKDLANSQSPAFLFYTGGTTGVPKAVVLTHQNVLANAIQFHSWLTQSELTSDDKTLAILPLSHSFGLQCSLLSQLIAVRKIIMMPSFNPTKIVEIIKEERVGYFAAVPTMYIALLNTNFNKSDFSSVKVCISGGAALPKDVFNDFKEKTDLTITEGYGLTECSPVTHVNVINKPVVGSIGYPLPDTKCKIISTETGIVLPNGKIGELIIKGPQVMKGYYKKSMETMKVFTADGWLKTGDIALIDDDGYTYIKDRLKDVINSGGFKVYPSEVENILQSHDAIKMVAIKGVSDDYFGEAVKAYIVKNENKDISYEDIKEYCKDKLASYKIPKTVTFVDSLPISAAGKILRKDLD